MEDVIQVKSLTHLYGQNQALSQLSFAVRQGEVFGLLGPNGAGKTTTVRLLNGLFEPTRGEIEVMGINPIQEGAKVRALSGVLTETPALYERLNARQNLRFFGVLAGLSDQEIDQRSDQLLEMFGLSARANDRTGTYSKGMKQRLALARAWLTRPKLLFLDEPTSGLDPEAAVQVRELIAEVRQKEGTTVMLCTHNLDEAQRLCDRLLVMKQGSAIAQGSLTDLRNLVSQGLWVEFVFLEDFDATSVSNTKVKFVLAMEQKTPIHARFEIATQADIPDLIRILSERGAKIVRVQPQEISLEEIYLHLQNGFTTKNGGKNELA